MTRYLDRFPAEHRESADRAYQDGFADACEDISPRVIEFARSIIGALDDGRMEHARREAVALMGYAGESGDD